MTITILQTDIAWADPERNISQAEELMRQAAASDLYVLPEMWATGFCVEPADIAKTEEESDALTWMKHTAQQRQCAVSGSLPIIDADGTFRNRHFFVTPGNVTRYDKRHLFSYGHEDKHYKAGQSAVIAEWKGWRILLQTCYDLRFPVFSRYGNMGEYDAIIYVANWPATRQTAWDTLLRARAIENQCFVIGANRVGSDPSCSYNGGSMVIDPLGRPIVESPEGIQASLAATISIEKLQQMRQRFRVLDDRDHIVLQP